MFIWYVQANFTYLKIYVYGLRMDFEAILLYNKIILGSATPKGVRNITNKYVLQKQKNVLEKSKATPIKMYGTCQRNKDLKKTINE